MARVENALPTPMASSMDADEPKRPQPYRDIALPNLTKLRVLTPLLNEAKSSTEHPEARRANPYNEWALP